jgi:ATP-dependent Clp protease ATP-binding subunit ClpA
VAKPLSLDPRTSSTRFQQNFSDECSYAERLEISPDDKIEFEREHEVEYADEAFAVSKALLSK